MSFLAIDTCEATCSAAILADDGAVRATRSDTIGRGHAEHLLPMIDSLHRDACTAYADVSRIAVTTGPGSFTGVRVGLSVARGLALALSVPCIGVMSLPVLAVQAAIAGGAEGRVHAVVAGRGGQVFHQAFDVLPSMVLPRARTEAACLDGSVARALIARHGGLVCGSGAEILGFDAVVSTLDPVLLGRLAADLDPVVQRPEPAYLRPADAARAKPPLPVTVES